MSMRAMRVRIDGGLAAAAAAAATVGTAVSLLAPRARPLGFDAATGAVVVVVVVLVIVVVVVVVVVATCAAAGPCACAGRIISATFKPPLAPMMTRPYGALATMRSMLSASGAI